MGKSLQDYYAVNPLEDPIVKVTLEQVQMCGRQLIEMSVKDLNKRLAGCSTSVVSKLKRCRRTLKNRGYAKSCRIKRIAARSELEQVNARLSVELNETRQRVKLLADQINGLLREQSSVRPNSSNCRDAVGRPQQSTRPQELVQAQLALKCEPPVHSITAHYSCCDSSAPGQRHHSHQQQYGARYNHHDHQGFPQNYIGGSSSTCNSSPSSSSSSTACTIGSAAATTAAEIAYRSLEADLEFALGSEFVDSQHVLVRQQQPATGSESFMNHFAVCSEVHSWQTS